MIDVDNYFKGFKPKFNKKKFDYLMENTPISFKIEEGIISSNTVFVRSVLTSCKLLNQELDRNNIYVGREGSGKSHCVFQHTYIWWWCLNELDMINYDFGLHLIYFKLQDLSDAFDMYKDIPYMIFTLDESDELNRKNWNKVAVKTLMSKLRRERKNLRVVNLLMPQLYEMLPDITLSRINWIIEVDMDLDHTFEILRGSFKLFCVPSGNYLINVKQKKVTRLKVLNVLNYRLYNSDEKFFSLPLNILMFHGNINKTFALDKIEYLKMSRVKNAEREDEDTDDLNYKAISEIKKEYNITWKVIGSMFNMSEDGIRKKIKRATDRLTIL